MKILTTFIDCKKCQEKDKEGCCYFLNEDKYFAPILIEEEAQLLDKQLLTKYKNFHGVYQIKLIPSKKRKGYFVCPFFNEENKRCSVYKKRPLDCQLWPIVMAYSKDKKMIEIVCADKNCCPKLKQMNEKDFNKYKKHIVDFLNSQGFRKRIKKYPGIIWEYQKDYFKIGVLTP